MKISSGSLLLVTALVLLPERVYQQASFRTITIDTSEVTTPGVAVTPDGRTLVFSAIGHLFELPVAGGATTQLTFGPSYDFDPAMSPDGSRVAFASNRDGSGSNIFVLDRASKRVTQISREVEAARPVWSPDGKTIAYARNVLREDHSLELMPGFADNGLREIRTVSADGGQPTVLGPPITLESLFYLPDGRLAWSVTERNPGGGMFQSSSRRASKRASRTDRIRCSSPSAEIPAAWCRGPRVTGCTSAAEAASNGCRSARTRRLLQVRAFRISRRASHSRATAVRSSSATADKSGARHCHQVLLSASHLRRR